MGSFRRLSTAQGLGISSSQSSDKSSPSSPKPRFADAVVSTIARPLTNEEHWALYYFESHARTCTRCYNPYAVQKRKDRLCSEGHLLAQNLSLYLTQGHDGHIRSASRTEQSEKVDGGYADVWVEIPRGFENALGLLKAIERSMRHREKFVAFEKAHTSPRKEKHAVKEPVIHHTKHSKSYHTVTAEPEIVEWPRHERETTEEATPVIKPSNRGSLYEADMRARQERERKEQQLPYRVELREPRAGRHPHRHSVFWN
ncbi:hypothetical protein P152DRAFT_317294 [Eremomyces bilateralis CBS 781.70]|uniref:Uncharacterized protein n=1 Tax=Eremomyces bilateralis CBS 781.70 TaxID=1392243 RepID=A0A6G1G5R7_9PEZI|nr:uncharacterized protein P152DRAFT_317294 [Eremomyces bilateralis CBS 781.70]KAF1813394.1 hypothetical protein P152DRAFT_317294 [Eremomyces bilateralis CBS 781.70]